MICSNGVLSSCRALGLLLAAQLLREAVNLSQWMNSYLWLSL